ncbi:glycosyl transferase [Peptostreptococcus sp.]|uniref:glycosyl transferase n=1 Tax=Peptostreptococcus sp. TaxID=1262 RepID=UPI001CB39AE1|nr:glycosyl transferase [uncultured Peptostreptococcus sp.]MBF1049162.1 glycosyl transferase [Peptostreptococcus sp.]
MYTYFMTIMLFCIGIAITLLSIPMISKMLENSGMIRENYRGDMIPVGLGLVFIPSLVINSIILIYSNIVPEKIIMIYMLLFASIAMSFVGIIDDSLGNRGVTGLIGHFKALFKGSLTTGAFKALLGGFVGLTLAVTLSKSIPNIIVATLVVALSTNMMNLFDLRPGRAIKAYVILAIIIFLASAKFNREVMMLIVPAVLAYFYFDLRALTMMGDAGSNVLGVSIGVFIVSSFDLPVQLVSLVLLVAIHVLTEKFSLTKIIENNKFLNYVDKLGRGL